MLNSTAHLFLSPNGLLKLSLLVLIVFAGLSAPIVQAQPATFDTPLTEYVSFVGNLKAVAGGISLYNPPVTGATYNLDVPMCAGGITPTITAAYVNYYTRHRSSPAQPNVIPTFDTTLDLSINGGAVQGFASTDTFHAVFPTSFEPGFFHRIYGIIDITSYFQNNFVAGSNTITVSDLQFPPESAAEKLHYGTGIIVVYGCAEFPLARVSVYAGLDWFFEGLPTEPYAGLFSDVFCLTFPASAQERTLNLDGIIGGQANATAPFRPHRMYYITGSGTPPSTTQNPPEPVLPSLPGVQEFPPNTVWTSNLGQEWDHYQNTVTIPAGSTYLCLQAESRTAGGILGISGDLLSPVFTLPLDQAADTPTSTSTNTPTNTATNTPTATATNTATSTATDTPTNTATSTPTETPTNTPTNTATSTATDTPTNTATSTPTGTPTETPTETATSTPTETPTSTVTETPTGTPTETPTGTLTPSSTPTETPTETPTGTPTETPTGTLTETATSTPTETPTGTLTETATSTVTGTVTVTETGTVTSTPTETPTGTLTAITPTGTVSVTTVTPTASATLTDPFVVTLIKNVNPPFATRGDEVVWTITVSNPDPTLPAVNIAVVDVVPAQFEIVSVSASAGTVSFSGQQVNFTLAFLGVGQSVDITIVSRVRSDAPLPFIARNSVTLTGDGLPPRSAQATVVSASSLPATGERSVAWWMVAAMLVGVGIVFVVQRNKREHG